MTHDAGIVVFKEREKSNFTLFKNSFQQVLSNGIGIQFSKRQLSDTKQAILYFL